MIALAKLESGDLESDIYEDVYLRGIFIFLEKIWRTKYNIHKDISETLGILKVGKRTSKILVGKT